MNYQIINKELNIAASGIADLTAEQAQSFLNSWGKGAKLGSLTLYMDSETNAIVLNRDNKRFELFLELTENYLTSTEDKRKMFRKKYEEKFKEEFCVLDTCIERRNIKKQLDIIGHSCIGYGDEMPILNALYKEYDPAIAIVNAFRYGVMCGKREERKRKSKKADENVTVLINLLSELEKMTVTELRAFRMEWLEELRKSNATDKILCFSGTVVDAVIQKKGGEVA